MARNKRSKNRNDVNPTRRAGQPNNIWAKMLAGARYFGDEFELVSERQKQRIRRMRAQRDGVTPTEG